MRANLANWGGQALAVVAVCLLSSSAAAAVGMDDLPTGEAVLDGHVEATGGEQALRDLSSLKMSGSLIADLGGHKLDAEFEIHASAPGNWHLSVESPGIFKTVKACNGTDAWEVNDSTGTRKMEGAELKQTISQSMFHLMVDWRKLYKDAETVGIVDLDGAVAYEVRLTPHDGAAVTQYYDKESGRLVKTDRTIVIADRGEVKMEVHWNEYQQFGLVWLPTEVIQVLHDVPGVGSGTQAWTYTSVEQDVEVPSSLFELPEELDGE